jgi:hypothetical protein
VLVADPRKDPVMTVAPRRRRVSLPAILAALVGLAWRPSRSVT